MIVSARKIYAASFPTRTLRAWIVEASAFTLAQIQSLNTVPQVLFTPPAGEVVIPRNMVAVLNAGSVAFSGAITLGLTVGATALATVCAMLDGTASTAITGDTDVFEGINLVAEAGLPMSLKSAANRTGGTGAGLWVAVEFWTVKISDLI